MATDSSQPGYLLPITGGPVLDADLDAVIQQAIVAITGLDGSMVQSQCSSKAANRPDPNDNECRFSVVLIDPEDQPVEYHNNDGTSDLIEYETIHLHLSFYGAQAGAYAKRLRNGLYLAQNRSTLQLSGLSLIDVGKFVLVPEVVEQVWIRRYDLIVRLWRKTSQTYRVLNLCSAEADIKRDTST